MQLRPLNIVDIIHKENIKIRGYIRGLANRIEGDPDFDINCLNSVIIRQYTNVTNSVSVFLEINMTSSVL